MKPSNTIVVSPKYIEEKERQIADLSKKVELLQEQLDIVTEQRDDIHIDKQVLQKQLNEANEVIKWYAQTDTGSAKDYLEKWGVK